MAKDGLDTVKSCSNGWRKISPIVLAEVSPDKTCNTCGSFISQLRRIGFARQCLANPQPVDAFSGDEETRERLVLEFLNLEDEA